MSIEEMAETYGLSTYESSTGDNLMRVVRRVYRSDDPTYYTIIKGCNKRFDWNYIKPGSVIYYISKQIIDRNYGV